VTRELVVNIFRPEIRLIAALFNVKVLASRIPSGVNVVDGLTRQPVIVYGGRLVVQMARATTLRVVIAVIIVVGINIVIHTRDGRH